MWGIRVHKGTAAADLKPAQRLPKPVATAEVEEALAARPPWIKQWFEVDGETVSWLQVGNPFQGGNVERIESTSWPAFRFFVLVSVWAEVPR